jgi:hypothetical protein
MTREGAGVRSVSLPSSGQRQLKTAHDRGQKSRTAFVTRAGGRDHALGKVEPITT